MYGFSFTSPSHKPVTFDVTTGKFIARSPSTGVETILDTEQLFDWMNEVDKVKTL